jgi:hypothetical protein
LGDQSGLVRYLDVLSRYRGAALAEVGKVTAGGVGGYR